MGRERGKVDAEFVKYLFSHEHKRLERGRRSTEGLRVVVFITWIHPGSSPLSRSPSNTLATTSRTHEFRGL